VENSTWEKRRDAKRMMRATKKITSYVLCNTPKGVKPNKEDPVQRIIKVYLTLEDQVEPKHLQHRVGKREEFEAHISEGA
jgi:hypothetical protein